MVKVLDCKVTAKPLSPVIWGTDEVEGNLLWFGKSSAVDDDIPVSYGEDYIRYMIPCAFIDVGGNIVAVEIDSLQMVNTDSPLVLYDMTGSELIVHDEQCFLDSVTENEEGETALKLHDNSTISCFSANIVDFKEHRLCEVSKYTFNLTVGKEVFTITVTKHGVNIEVETYE